MDVPVHEQLRREPLDQRQEGLEALMGRIVLVADAEGWGMREQHVDPAAAAHAPGRGFDGADGPRRRISFCVYWFGPSRYRTLPPSPATRMPATSSIRPSTFVHPSGPTGSRASFSSTLGGQASSPRRSRSSWSWFPGTYSSGTFSTVTRYSK